MAWSLWQRRNKLRIDLPYHPLNQVGPHSTKFLQDYLDSQDTQTPSNSTTLPTQSWTPPNTNSFKANFDGAVFNNSNSTGVGVIIRDSNGEVIAAMFERILLPTTMMEVEMLACRRAVTFAIEVGIQDITFEGDSLTMIRAINSGGASEAPYGNLIEDILVYVSSFSSVVFKHVKRPCNKVADALAKKAKFGDMFQAWMEELPPDITPLAVLDVH